MVAVLAGLVVEGMLWPLPKWAPLNKPNAWMVDLAWLALVGVVAASLIHAMLYKFETGFDPVLWISSAALGAAGWFIGDFIRQFMTMRKK